MENIEKSNINISEEGIVVIDVPVAMTPRHTEDIHEIITKVPNWIIRWGIMFFFGILLIVVAISIVIRYPDTIKIGLKIETVNNSAVVVNRVAGTVLKLLVKSGQFVKKGQPLLYIARDEGDSQQISMVAPQDGKVAFVAIILEGYSLKPNQELFHIIPVQQNFFGILQIPKTEINRIRAGQNVLVKVTNYPVGDYGPIKGKITYVTDEPSHEGLFAVKVSFDNSTLQHKNITLKTWMTGSAEIVTEDVSVLNRIYNAVVKD